MLCPNCKKEIENGSKFCEHCGARVKKSKKWLWITLSVILMSVIATIVIITIQEQKAMEQNRVEQSKLELEQQLQAERIAKEEAEREAELARQKAARQAELVRQEAARRQELLSQGLVDLGLPSGTLWKNANEGGDYTRYTYDEAVSRFGNKLPTKQQFGELRNKCTWTWTGNGYKVTGPNGESIILPAAGCRGCNGGVLSVGSYGSYWSSTSDDSDSAWGLFFNSSEVDMGNIDRCCNIDRCFGFSVRLVQ